uniref:Uncharacterized protein n=1 Tax=Anguilla anguilla TaxID=7936 RepID=A0A0E9VTP3_ANGAN
MFRCIYKMKTGSSENIWFSRGGSFDSKTGFTPV